MSDWQQVSLDGARVDGLAQNVQGVLAWGELNGRPYAAEVAPDGTVLVADLPGTGPVTSATFNEYYELVVGTPPVHLYGGMPESSATEERFEVPDWTVVRAPRRLWVGCGDEDPMYVVADEHGELTGVDPGVGVAGPPSGIFLAGDVDSARLLVAGGEIGIRIAGRLRDRHGEESWQSWTCWGVEEATGGPDWERNVLEPVPSALTDLVEGFEPITAGHRDLRPLVWRSDGTPIDLPDVTLDPAYPMVSVANRHQEDPVSLAVQSPAGPQLWTVGGNEWSSVELPMGHLVLARRDLESPERVWVVIDGSLWTATTG